VELKLSLVLRVAAVAAAASVGVAYLFVGRLEARNRDEVERIGRVAARHVDFQLANFATGVSLPMHFPDWQPLAESVNLQGLCAAYEDESGQVTDSDCVGAEPDLSPAPGWFVWMARSIFQVGAPSRQAVGFRGFAKGHVVMTPQPAVAVSRLWGQALPVLEMLAAEVVFVSVLVWFAVAGALRPTGRVLDLLAKMADGDLSIRLPASRFAELAAIVAAVNRLSAKLQRTLAERADLARRLVDVHESERRNLARELHDELGQCLAAINAKAALIVQRASPQSPEVAAQAQGISQVATSTLQQLRDTLVRLRPPEIDELGLMESVRRMVLAWRADQAGIGCRFEASGTFDDVPMAVSVSLYRIAQECLTNVARHAGATDAVVSLARPTTSHVELTVADDGRGLAPGDAGPGLGLVGMRERVAAFQGSFHLEASTPCGLCVRVTLPISVAPALLERSTDGKPW
jgi:signal transduction histidine kinase